jgi:TATA-box binding protein (TBP) (component of TFIID and TFIIIB)
MSSPEVQNICSWTCFNILSRDEVTVVEDTVGYLPTINAPATQMSTVNEVLIQSINIMQSLELNAIVCVFDQALFAKAAEVVWKHPEKFKGIILRLGVFHIICTLLSTIGKRFQDGGLRDICVEAGVIADGSIA